MRKMSTVVLERTRTTIRGPFTARNKTDVLQNSLGKHLKNMGFPMGTEIETEYGQIY